MRARVRFIYRFGWAAIFDMPGKDLRVLLLMGFCRQMGRSKLVVLQARGRGLILI